MSIPILSDVELRDALLSGEVSETRARKFLRLAPTPEQSARVVALLDDGDVKTAWTTAITAVQVP